MTEAIEGAGGASGEPRKRSAPKTARRHPVPSDEDWVMSFDALCEHLKLPKKWFARQVREGRFPCTRVGRRLVFDPRRVMNILQRLTQYEGVRGQRVPV